MSASDPEEQSELSIIFGVSLALIIITWVSVILRLAVRTSVLRTFGYDDLAMLGAQAFFTAGCAIIFVIVRKDVAYYFHHSDSALDHIVLLEKLIHGSYTLTMICIKISLAILFLTLFPRRKILRRIIVAQVSVSSMVGIAFLFLVGFTCGVQSPLATAASVARCPPQKAFLLVTGIWALMTAAGDLMFCGLSVLALKDAELSLRSKVPAAALLMLSTAGSVASFIRVGIILSAARSHNPPNILLIGRWSVIEAGLAITCAGLVTIRPVFRCCGARIADRSPSEKTWTKTAKSRQKRRNLSTQTSVHGIVSVVGDIERSGGLTWTWSGSRKVRDHSERQDEVVQDSWDPDYVAVIRETGDETESFSAHECNRPLQTYGLI